MNIGYMDRRIELQLNAGTLDGYGATSSSWTTSATVWAAMDTKGSSTSIEFEQETAKYLVTWRIRSSSTTRNVTPKWRVKYGTDLYEIKAVQEKGRNDELHLITERIVAE